MVEYHRLHPIVNIHCKFPNVHVMIMYLYESRIEYSINIRILECKFHQENSRVEPPLTREETLPPNLLGCVMGVVNNPLIYERMLPGMKVRCWHFL